MNRISKAPADLGKSYQIIVVGSGYGGGVAASRLARAGQEVCVLERGREILPGDYPDTLLKANKEMQIDTENGRVGSPVGLYNMHVNPDVNVFVGCGLGGTSLINANVALEMDPRQFKEDDWPTELVPDPKKKDENGKQPTPLDEYYEHARVMLGSTEYPEHYPDLNKLDALQRAAEYIGEGKNFYRPPINVTFEDKLNEFGVEQPACNRCGDCCSGCNVGSKNTTLMNYLPDAANHGAEIFTLCRVEYLERIAEGDEGFSGGARWKVHVQTFNDEKDETEWVEGEMKVVVAEMVVLAAGTLGSTEILLRSKKENGLPLSDYLGKKFSGNGDVVALGYNCYWENEDGTRPGGKDIIKGMLAKSMASSAGPTMNGASDKGLKPKPIYGIGVGANAVDPAAYPGPCITGIIDLRYHDLPEKRLVIEEGVIPGALGAGLPPGLFFGNVLTGNPALYGPDQLEARMKDAVAVADAVRNSPTSLSELCYKGSMARSQTYLVMSHDEAEGTLELGDEDRVQVAWEGAGRSPVIENDNAVLEQINLATQGQFLSNPLWTEPLGKQLITVHPVGGCRMSDSFKEGVVNHRCQVYAAEDNSVHDGLFVCDGAVMPGAVGVNPLLTISAVSERAMHELCKEKGWTYDTSLEGVEVPAESVDIWERFLDGVRDLLAAIKRGMKWLVEKMKALAMKIPIALAKKILKALADRYPEQFSPSLKFNEVMRGYISLDIPDDKRPASERVSDDYDLCVDKGKRFGESHQLEGHFTVKAEKMEELTNCPLHPAKISGFIKCEALAFTGDSKMEIVDGDLNLLKVDTYAVETWVMTYNCKVSGGMDLPDHPEREATLFFKGKKILHQKPGSFLWTDVTRLYVDVYRGEGAEEVLIARGIINLGVSDLLAQGMSLEMKPTTDIQRWLEKHVPAAFTGLCTLFGAKFAAFFGMTLFRAYGGLMSDLANFQGLEDEKRKKDRRPLRAPKPVTFDSGIFAKDKASNEWRYSLTRYQPEEKSGAGKKCPVILAPGFSVAASSFAALTVDCNLVEYLTSEGYDVWLFDYQASPNSGHAELPFTIDDIVKQWKHAIDFICDAADVDEVQAVAHCVGSMTLLMALMAYPDLRVKSAVCSQTTLHPVTNWLNYAKVDIGLAGIIGGEMEIVDLCTVDQADNSRGQGSSKPTDDEVTDAKTIDTMLWNVPVPPGEECTNPVCRRVFSLFGPSWTHSQLGHDTHIALREWFGKISTKPFEQLADIMRLGYPVTSDGEDEYMPNVERLQLPLTFFAGEKNQIFLTETSRRTYDWLCAHNGEDYYKRIVFEGYAHMDFFVGKTASDDIFPLILAALEQPFEPPQETEEFGAPAEEVGTEVTSGEWRWTPGKSITEAVLSRLGS